jgi:hypothetical protein
MVSPDALHTPGVDEVTEVDVPSPSVDTEAVKPFP